MKKWWIFAAIGIIFILGVAVSFYSGGEKFAVKDFKYIMKLIVENI